MLTQILKSLLLLSGGSIPFQQSAMQAPPARMYALTATEALALMKNDTVTVEAYARALLDRIEERDDVVKAWTHLDKELVIRQARALDGIPREQRGPLHGVAVAIKDIMNTKDMPTQFGSPLYKGNWPNVDASPVSILRSAGALILGPKTTNPHDSARTPGGSSTGSAAAVADFQVPLSLGTQNGGSVIRPASYTGIFAMKPTHNAISAEGVKLVSFNIDTCGFFARSIEDLQLVADVFAFKSDESLSTFFLQDARIAFVRTPFWNMVGDGTVKAMSRAADILAKHGAIVEDVELPPQLNDAQALKRTQKIVLNVEAQAAFLKEYRMDKTKLDPKICGFVENQSNFTIEEMACAMDTYNNMRSEFDKFAAGYAAIIAPSAQDVAPLGLGDMGDSSLNFLWTGLHTPTIHIPAFEGENGLPVGLSVVAGRYRDQYLLRMCEVLSKPLMEEGGWDIDRLATRSRL